jgi:hypothetical protein
VVSAVGSVADCGFLMMALVNVVQVKLGRLGCGARGSAAWDVVVPLITLVPAALLTLPPLFVVLRRREMQGLPIVRPPLLRGDAGALTQLADASMARRTGWPLDYQG